MFWFVSYFHSIVQYVILGSDRSGMLILFDLLSDKRQHQVYSCRLCFAIIAVLWKCFDMSILMDLKLSFYYHFEYRTNKAKAILNFVNDNGYTCYDQTLTSGTIIFIHSIRDRRFREFRGFIYLNTCRIDSVWTLNLT